VRLRLPQRREQIYDGEDLTPFERAAVRFNASDAGHRVCGLVRTLGDPRVSVGSLAGAPEGARVTVAWDLSWYQWGVDLSEDPEPVRELAKGRELGEIDFAAQQWNASATAAGQVVIVAPRRR
jgi:hypothetical protein